MGSGKYPPLWRRPRTGPSAIYDCSCSNSCFDFAFEVEVQVTIFGESAGGWSVSHQLVGSSFLIQLSSVLFVQFSVLEFSAAFLKKCFKCRSILRQKVYSAVSVPFLDFDHTCTCPRFPQKD